MFVNYSAEQFHKLNIFVEKVVSKCDISSAISNTAVLAGEDIFQFSSRMTQDPKFSSVESVKFYVYIRNSLLTIK